MKSNDKLVLTSLLTAALGAVATLDAAYISKLDFAHHPGGDTSCDALFNSRAYPGTTATLVTINKNQTVSFARDAMTYDATVPRLVADVKQYFNDRRSGAQPFDQNQPDLLGISVMKIGSQVTVSTTLKSWGNTTSTMEPVCRGNFMIAFSPSNDAVVVLDLDR